MFISVIGTLISLTVVSAGYIDYNICNWLWGAEGISITCPYGSVGVGACGSSLYSDCSNGNYNVGLRCCQLVATEKDGDPRQCVTHRGPSGQPLTCGGDRPCVYSTCGSGAVPVCGTDAYTSISCCITPELDTTGQCRWQYGESGMNLVCSTAGEVLSGRCGVGFNTDCPNTSAHGIYCCSYN